MGDLQTALTTLAGKHERYAKYWNYYNGNHPLMYTTNRLNELFANISTRFRQNWCSVVVNAVVDRLELEGLSVAGNDALTKTLNDLWAASEIDLDSDDVHLAVAVVGEAFLVVWPNEAGVVEAYYNDPANCFVCYDPENPRAAQFAAKWWVNPDGYRCVTLYYSDRLEHWVSVKKDTELSISSYKEDGFVPDVSAGEDGRADNPYGQIPVFHFRKERRGIISELDDVLEPQNAVNKLLNDMMIVAEYGAFPQRYIIGNLKQQSVLKNAPNEIWFFPGNSGLGDQPTSVGQFQAATLSGYLEAIDKLAGSIAIVTRTPKHFFFMQTGDPSGEALIAMEAPLVKKAKRYIKRLEATWRKVAAFVARVAKAGVVPENLIDIRFTDPRSVQPVTVANVLTQERAAGVPLKTCLRRAGWSDAELQQLEKDLAEEKAEEKSMADAAMDEAFRRLEQGAGFSAPQPPREAA